jgi:hypothetical protein
MEKTVRLLCMLSVFCALATQLCPEGREKRVLGFVCSVVLLSALFRSVRQPDWDSLALEAALLHQREEAFLQDAGDLGRELQRTVIEEKCEAYIRNRAGQIQIDLEEAAVTAQWSLEGIWVPHSAMLFGDVGERERAQLAAILEAELGIPRSRQ